MDYCSVYYFSSREYSVWFMYLPTKICFSEWIIDQTYSLTFLLIFTTSVIPPWFKSSLPPIWFLRSAFLQSIPNKVASDNQQPPTVSIHFQRKSKVLTIPSKLNRDTIVSLTLFLPTFILYHITISIWWISLNTLNKHALASRPLLCLVSLQSSICTVLSLTLCECLFQY